MHSHLNASQRNKDVCIYLMHKYLIILNGSDTVFELLILAGCVKVLLSVKLTPKEMRVKEKEKKKMKEEIQFAPGGGREWGGWEGGGGVREGTLQGKGDNRAAEDNGNLLIFCWVL